MKDHFLLAHLLLLFATPLLLTGQPNRITGLVYDATTARGLPRAHVTVVSDGLSGTVTNEAGVFTLFLPPGGDSLRCSHLGYDSRSVAVPALIGDTLRIALSPSSYALDAVVVQPLDPRKLVEAAAAAIPEHFPPTPFEARGFYRELIRDPADYLSVVESVFQLSLFPEEKEKDRRQLRLVRGRSSEDVKATRLFEDFHPAGGPNLAAGLDLRIDRPTFLQPGYFDRYEYELEDRTVYDGRQVYVIAFDQRPGVEEALSRGRLYLDAESLAVLRYESRFSPRGAPYRKHLSGKDKLFAQLLKIDFVQKAGEVAVNYRPHQGRWFLSDVHSRWVIDYKQPKKEIETEVTIESDLVLTELHPGEATFIPADERWQRRQVVRRLPAAGDDAFWGEANYLSPGRSVAAAIAKLGEAGPLEARADTLLGGWRRLNPEQAAVYIEGPAIIMQPLMPSYWHDDAIGPMLRRQVTGDFVLQARISISAARDTSALPRAGWQQGGLMARSARRGDGGENHLLLSIGTVGNPKMRLLRQSTHDDRSVLKMEKIDLRTIDLRLLRQGSRFECWIKAPDNLTWQLLDRYDRPDLGPTLEVGPAAYTHLPGKGPLMAPDLKVRFENLEVKAHDH